MTTLLFRDDPYLKRGTASVTSVDDRTLRLDATIFYPMGGGQPGDTGRLSWAGGEIAIVDTRKGDRVDEIAHLAAADGPLPAPGTPVELTLDWERRHRLMRMHTAMHLLCAVVEGSVTGGQVGADRSRLDFAVETASLDRDAIREAVNALVAAAHPVAPVWIDEDELRARPDLVRTMSVKPPTGSGRVRLLRIGTEASPVDLQPCGGTHVANTAEIGPIDVVKIENKGRQNRRVVLALTGEG